MLQVSSVRSLESDPEPVEQAKTKFNEIFCVQF